MTLDARFFLVISYMPDAPINGYLGGRLTLPQALRDTADQAVLDYANAAGWSVTELFAWAKSKSGRWFIDSITDDLHAGRLWKIDSAVRLYIDGFSADDDA